MESKILSRAALLRAVKWERSKGNRIALANGVFDLLHVGHVRYLQAARRRADRLVVALNSDASARSLKGSGRPVLPQRDRAEIVAALECVDYVTLFGETTATRLVAAIAPDIHCKGTDYLPGTVPEREAVLAAGGRIAIVGDPKSHASRDLIRTILNRFGTAGR